MDCAACGKTLSVTAKFCGKCGAPVKRPSKGLDSDASQAQPSLALVQSEDPAEAVMPETSPQVSKTDATRTLTYPDRPEEDELVIPLAPDSTALEDQTLLNIDLNLVPPEGPVAHSGASWSEDLAWVHRIEMHQQELKKTLEKHSLLLDFISLASQQQSHQQAQPDPNETLLHNLIEQQTQFAVQLAELQNHWQSHAVSGNPARIPEEFKLLLEKQKIEIQKSFSQNVAQNSENLAFAHEAEMLKVQEMLKANTVAAEGIEKKLAPLIQSVNDLKTKVQALVKKADDSSPARSKSGTKDEATGEGGGFMIFIIGMLCGLTVVLSSLAIYNFLSHSSLASPAAKGQDKAAVESGDKAHDKAAPQSHGKPDH